MDKEAVDFGGGGRDLGGLVLYPAALPDPWVKSSRFFCLCGWFGWSLFRVFCVQRAEITFFGDGPCLERPPLGVWTPTSGPRSHVTNVPGTHVTLGTSRAPLGNPSHPHLSAPRDRGGGSEGTRGPQLGHTHPHPVPSGRREAASGALRRYPRLGGHVCVLGDRCAVGATGWERLES